MLSDSTLKLPYVGIGRSRTSLKITTLPYRLPETLGQLLTRGTLFTSEVSY